jgi:hypothetical protein
VSTVPYRGRCSSLTKLSRSRAWKLAWYASGSVMGCSIQCRDQVWTRESAKGAWVSFPRLHESGALYRKALTTYTGTANPTSGLAIIVLMPTNWPPTSTSGPPEWPDRRCRPTAIHYLCGAGF